MMGVTGMAQGSRSVSKTVSDNGDSLKLKYEVICADKSINYSNQFYVKGWSKDQKDQLVTRIIDSLENNPATAPDTENVTRHISDDGQTMKVEIEATKNGNKISYNKSFNVKGLSKQQKKEIVNDVLKSLGLTTRQ